MKNIGLLCTKNEERVVEEVLLKNEKFVDSIYAIDGSTDSTPQIIKKFKKLELILLEKDLHAPTVDGIRQYLLDEIERKEGYGNWVTLLHGDEIFYHSPLKVIQAAEKEQVDGVIWFVPHFFLHISDKKKWEQIKDLPLEERVTYYAIGRVPWREFRQFKFHEGVKYDRTRHHHVTPDGMGGVFSLKPILKHYKVHTKEQFKIFGSRWGGLPFIPQKPEEEIFMEKLPANIPSGRYERAIKFTGDFGELEKGLEHLK